MIQRFAEGSNYHIDLHAQRAVCRVWCRPDLDSAQGAALAVEKIALFRRLALGSTEAMLFDLSEAPAVTGPKTQQALSEMLDAWESTHKPIAVVSGPNSVQQLQLRRLLASAAPVHGVFFTTLADAEAWLEARPSRR